MTLTQRDFDGIEKIVDERIEDRTRNLPTKDEFFEKMDEMMGELKTIREGQEILTHKVYRDHEPRISKVEKKLQIHSSV